MATNFPTSLDSYTTKVNIVDTISAADINNLQDATVAIETLLTVNYGKRTAWTPAFVWASPGTSTWSYSTRGGYALTIGSLVIVQGYIIATPTLGTASGQLYINGLPSNLVTATTSYMPIMMSNCSGFTTYPANGMMYSGSDVIRLYRTSNVADTLTTAHVTGGTAITVIFSGFYWAS